MVQWCDQRLLLADLLLLIGAPRGIDVNWTGAQIDAKIFTGPQYGILGKEHIAVLLFHGVHAALGSELLFDTRLGEAPSYRREGRPELLVREGCHRGLA